MLVLYDCFEYASAFIITYLPLLILLDFFFFGNKSRLPTEVTCFQPEELPLVFLVRQVC